jgi:hypothetical protein
MESYGEVRIPEFLRLMKAYLEGQIDACSYRDRYFALMKRRMILDEVESRMIQQATATQMIMTQYSD